KSLEIGVHLTEIADGLRRKLESTETLPSSDISLQVQLEESSNEFWKAFRGISERLDLCQNFYRSTKKLLQSLEDVEKNIQSKLKLFGEIRRDFVVRRYRRIWKKILSAYERCRENGLRLLQILQEPLVDHHR
ncbi:uncharacterized protein TNIN_332851, partial [Trichonephila inaurata madagascariensis]